MQAIRNSELLGKKIKSALGIVCIVIALISALSILVVMCGFALEGYI